MNNISYIFLLSLFAMIYLKITTEAENPFKKSEWKEYAHKSAAKAEFISYSIILIDL